MNAGKSTSLLQASHNYRERGMQTYLMTAKMDTRAGKGKIASRIGIEENSDTFSPQEDLFEKIKSKIGSIFRITGSVQADLDYLDEQDLNHQSQLYYQQM
mgnify:CR=1 FL=1